MMSKTIYALSGAEFFLVGGPNEDKKGCYDTSLLFYLYETNGNDRMRAQACSLGVLEMERQMNKRYGF